MAYPTPFEPTIFITEVVVIPKIGVVIFELRLCPIHAVDAHSVEVPFRPLTRFTSDGVVVTLTGPDAGTFVRYLVIEFLQLLQQVVYAIT